jgi:hypothetical protein
MKKSLLLILSALIVVFVFISGTFNSGGSHGAKTGSPLDGANCARCHNSEVTSVEWISSDIPQTGYLPGQKYKVTITANDPAAVKMGFEITAETTAGKQGTFSISDSARTQLTNNNAAVTHKYEGISPINGKITWSCDWMAPVKGTGNVTFYASINAANGNRNPSGDKIYTSTLVAKEAVPTIQN